MNLFVLALLVDVKDLIETRNLADLKAAMGCMKDAEAVESIGHDNRRSLLLSAQKNFSIYTLGYR